jgi:[acyl-carrier-protein] S-malonyltransferase
MKTVFVFPGQGSQFAGMGKSLAEEFPVARQIFDRADQALGYSLSKLCFEGPEEQLKQTEYTQPALVAVSTAAFAVLSQAGLKPDAVAGHSLGEYSALVAAGSLDLEPALRLVRARGRYMQAAVPEGVGAMAALLKLPEEALAGVLEAAAQGEIVSAANFNSPDQVVIAGHAGAVERAMELAKAAGARRAVPLPVSAPFHCALMRPAQLQLQPKLRDAEFQRLSFPLVNNWAARRITQGDDARTGLFEQIPNPVRWTESVRALAADRWVEVGPGTVLSGLIKQIIPGAKVQKFGAAEDLPALREFLVAR